MISCRIPSIVTLASLLGGQAAAAQSAQQISGQVSVISVAPSGDAYEGMSSGVGFEAQLRYTPSAFSVGAGYQSSAHDVDMGDEFGTEDATISGFFVEPRYVIDVGSEAWAPYLSARLARLTQAADLDELDVRVSASGTQINAGGGVLVRLSPRINLDLGLTYGKIDFDDGELTVDGETYVVEGTGGSGNNLVLRAGVTIGLK
ncbi:MAG TPA: outer membrane beta-barrel protein [Gemmatimonadales bacterium]|nr:outer membrane beta-barrel protein [Gemmatimonadales bacterium]